MSSNSTLLGVLRAIEASQKPKKVPALTHYKSSGPAPYTNQSKGPVNPKTSKGDTGHKTGSVLDIFKNLGYDISDTVRGMPGGVIQTIHHPVATAEAIGKDYARRYSPLIHGDFGKFAHEVAQHPLAPALDALAVASLGGGAVAKVGQSTRIAATVDAAKGAQVAKAGAETALARKTIEALSKKKAKVMVDRNAAEARVNNLKNPVDVQASSAKSLAIHEKTIDKIQSEIAKQSRMVVEKRPAGELSKPVQALVKLQKLTAPRYRYISAEKGALTKSIRVAQSSNPVKRLRQNLGLNVQESKYLPTNTPLIGLAQRAKKAANLQRQVDASRIRAAQVPVRDAIDHIEKLGKSGKHSADAMALAAQGLIDGVRPSDYARLVRDTRSHGLEIQKSINKGLTQEQHHAETERLVAGHTGKSANDLYDAARQAIQREGVKRGSNINGIYLQHGFKHELIDSPEVAAVVRLQKAHEAAANDAMQKLVTGGHITADQASQQAVLHTNLVRDIKGQKKLSPEEVNAQFDKAGLPRPVYNPDTLTIGEAASKKSMLSESTGKLYARGTRINSPMNIVLRHELASRATDMKSAHLLMLSAARKIPPGERLPKGWVWVKDSVAATLDQKHAINAEQMADGVPINADYYTLLEHEKRPNGGMALPRHVADDIAMGKRAMTEARNAALAKGMQVWKYAVLFRPAFAVHNFISNQLMFHLKNGWNFPSMARAREALKSGVFKEHHGAESITFADDAKMMGKSKVGRALSKGMNSFYHAVGWHEQQLRQLTMYETARKMPQVQREMRRLKGGATNLEGKTLFHVAYNAAVKKDPSLRDLITRQMDDTLGNYRYYTQTERQLKNLSPFYGWERHSVRNLIRMVEDNPATMAMLTQIGMVGHKKWNKDFGPGMPDFVRSYVQDSYIHSLAEHLGLGDKVDMYDFNSTNPWTTALDVGEAALGKKGAMTNLAGPLLTAPMEELTGKSLLTGAPVKKMHTSNPIESMIERVIQATPPAQTYENLTSTQNEKKKLLKTGDKQYIGQQFGLDTRQLDKEQAKKMVANQNAPRDKYGHLKKKKKANPFYK